MAFPILDFLTGFFLMNAMPHLLVGLFRIRFLGLFGYSPTGNVGYAFFNIALSLAFFHIQHGLQDIVNHGVLLGGLAMFAIYLVAGRTVYEFFQRNNETS